MTRSSTSTATLSSAVAVGDVIVVVLPGSAYYGSSNLASTLDSITDNQSGGSNTYTLVDNEAISANPYFGQYALAYTAATAALVHADAERGNDGVRQLGRAELLRRGVAQRHHERARALSATNQTPNPGLTSPGVSDSYSGMR